MIGLKSTWGHVSARDKYFHATWLASAIHSLPFHLRIRILWMLCVCSLIGIILHFPALCALARWLALICAEWLYLRQWFLMVVMQKRFARKNESALSPAWHRSQFMRSVHRLKSKKSFGGSKEKKCFHAPDVCWLCVRKLTFVRSLVCCTFNFCYSTLDFAHSRRPFIRLIAQTRAANLIDNETSGHSIAK